MNLNLWLETFSYTEGKLIRPVHTEATGTGNATSKRLHVEDY